VKFSVFTASTPGVEEGQTYPEVFSTEQPLARRTEDNLGYLKSFVDG
jgi:hypothetical protein